MNKCYIIYLGTCMYTATAGDSHRSPDSSKQGQQQQRTKEKQQTCSSEKDGLPFYFAGHRY